MTASAVHFAKYHGLGNDFVIVDLRGDDLSPAARERAQDPRVVQAICDRRFGVGGDGVLAILPARDGSSDARMRVLNADGSEAEMCGNGLRCVVKHLYERDESMRRDSLAIDTGAGSLTCAVSASVGEVHTVTVDMGRPRLTRREIPMTAANAESADDDLRLGSGARRRPRSRRHGGFHGQSSTWSSSSTNRGPPCGLWPKPSGRLSRPTSSFPERTNVEFAHVHSPGEIELVVWERGVGITLACGTGACATGVAACLTEQSTPGQEIEVRLLGGELFITVAPEYRTALMRGPATHVFDGELNMAGLSIERAS